MSIFKKHAHISDECAANVKQHVPLIDVKNVTLSYDGDFQKATQPEGDNTKNTALSNSSDSQKAAQSNSDTIENQALLSNVSFTVEPGRLYCLMGANGCGKTTLINCILGMHRQKNGIVYVGGTDVRKLRPAELAARAAFVPQTHEKTFPYTVEQIVMMGRSIYADMLRGPGDEERAIAEDVMRRTGIIHLAERPYTQISGGELQLVMLARALAQKTPVIIMDEPSAHLDFKNELIFMETVSELIRDEGTAVLMATHSPNHPFFFERNGTKTQVLAFAGGQLRYSGTPTDILTEENIREIYGIEARVLAAGDGSGGSNDDDGSGVIRQIVPLKAL